MFFAYGSPVLVVGMFVLWLILNAARRPRAQVTPAQHHAWQHLTDAQRAQAMSPASGLTLKSWCRRIPRLSGICSPTSPGFPSGVQSACTRRGWTIPGVSGAARFTGRNRARNGFEWAVTCAVTEAERPRTFAWTVLADPQEPGVVSSYWRCELQPHTGRRHPGARVVHPRSWRQRLALDGRAAAGPRG